MPEMNVHRVTAEKHFSDTGKYFLTQFWLTFGRCAMISNNSVRDYDSWIKMDKNFRNEKSRIYGIIFVFFFLTFVWRSSCLVYSTNFDVFIYESRFPRNKVAIEECRLLQRDLSTLYLLPKLITVITFRFTILFCYCLTRSTLVSLI